MNSADTPACTSRDVKRDSFLEWLTALDPAVPVSAAVMEAKRRAVDLAPLLDADFVLHRVE